MNCYKISASTHTAINSLMWQNSNYSISGVGMPFQKIDPISEIFTIWSQSFATHSRLCHTTSQTNYLCSIGYYLITVHQYTLLNQSDLNLASRNQPAIPFPYTYKVIFEYVSIFEYMYCVLQDFWSRLTHWAINSLLWQNTDHSIYGVGMPFQRLIQSK